MKSGWGSEHTKYFFDLDQDEVMDSLEQIGLRCTGACFTLNSYENRVYEVELEEDEETEDLHPIHRRRVVKFYRPGRWTQDQILEEHQFLRDLEQNEVPVVNVIEDEKGETLFEAKSSKLWFTVFPKVGGRIPLEPTREQYLQMGRLIARLHNVGESKPATHRISLSVESYGLANLEYLLANRWLPLEMESTYAACVRDICERTAPELEKCSSFRIHGDCHLGNILEDGEQLFFLDFDDMLNGPAVQDLWLLTSDPNPRESTQWSALLEGYEQMREFDDRSLRLVESLRALRMIHFSAWLARRWEDPAFKKAFSYFNTHRYWEEQLRDLKEQQNLVQRDLDR